MFSGKESSTKKKRTKIDSDEDDDDDDDFGWGITESKKSVGDAVQKNEKKILTRKADSIKNGLTSPGL